MLTKTCFDGGGGGDHALGQQELRAAAAAAAAAAVLAAPRAALCRRHGIHWKSGKIACPKKNLQLKKTNKTKQSACCCWVERKIY
jgi:hypothetical protein